jgi:hypothetical protein
VPYTLLGGGNIVRYYPPYGEALSTAFDFSVRDATVGSNVATVTVEVGVAQPVHSFPMDSDPGWSTEGDWEFGQPTGGGTHSGDPTSGYTGTNVYGYNLNGDYANGISTTQYLTTGAMDCTYLSNAELRFQRWLGIEAGWFDRAYLEVSNDGSNWTTLWAHETGDGEIDESSWSSQSYDVAAIADGQAEVYVRWGLGTTDGSNSYPGWNIDDVALWGVVDTPAGDFDGDLDIDKDDHIAFFDCMAGPDTTPNPLNPLTSVDHCLGAFDFDQDMDVDVKDYGPFQSSFTGAAP